MDADRQIPREEGIDLHAKIDHVVGCRGLHVGKRDLVVHHPVGGHLAGGDAVFDFEGDEDVDAGFAQIFEIVRQFGEKPRPSAAPEAGGNRR